MKLIYVLIVILSITFLTNAEDKKTHPSKKPEVVSFCQIIKNPTKYVNRKVKFTATYYSVISGTPVLLDSKCEQHSMLFDYNKSKFLELKRKIENNLKTREDQIGETANFSFVGVLKKNLIEGHTPIKGLLQNYTMAIESVKRH
jgi:hypothetical protein